MALMYQHAHKQSEKEVEREIERGGKWAACVIEWATDHNVYLCISVFVYSICLPWPALELSGTCIYGRHILCKLLAQHMENLNGFLADKSSCPLKLSP